MLSGMATGGFTISIRHRQPMRHARPFSITSFALLGLLPLLAGCTSPAALDPAQEALLGGFVCPPGEFVQGFDVEGRPHCAAPDASVPEGLTRLAFACPDGQAVVAITAAFEVRCGVVGPIGPPGPEGPPGPRGDAGRSEHRAPLRLTPNSTTRP